MPVQGRQESCLSRQRSGCSQWPNLWLLAAAFLTAVFTLLPTTHSAQPGADWFDDFYPYRIPISVNVPAAGEYQLELIPGTITQWTNQQADFKFNPKYFDYDNVRLVEVDIQGTVVDQEVDAGFRIRIGRELVVNGSFEERQNGKPVGWQVGHKAFKLEMRSHDGSWCMTAKGADRHGCVQNIPTQPNRWYQFTCRARGAGAVNVHYFPKSAWWRVIPHTYKDPYIPAEGWYDIAYYFNTWDKSGWQTDQIQIRMERYTGSADDISVRQCQVAFVLKADKPGPRRYLLYYAPIEGITSTVPSKRVHAIPENSLTVEKAGNTEYLDQSLRYSLASHSFCDLWYSSTLKKVFEDEPPPGPKRQRMSLSAARNESEAVQLVLTPKEDGELKSVSACLSGPRNYAFPKKCFDIRQAKFVTIAAPSKTGAGYREVSRSAFTGRLPDPLPKFAPLECKSGGPNIVIWIDVTVPKEAPAGLYCGEVEIDTSLGTISSPWELKVWDFTLPDRPACKTAFQFSRYANQYLFPFHGIEADRKDRYDISRAYIAEMARYKITARSPHSAGTWDPDKNPQNPFFSQEKELAWALDDLHVAAFGIGHFSGPSLGEETVESATATAKTYDEMAAFLKRKGWLPHAYIQIDEPQPRHYQGVRNWIEAFRRQPNAKDIRMFAFVYNGQCYDALADCVDILVPENNDGGNVASPTAIARWSTDKDRPGNDYNTSRPLTQTSPVAGRGAHGSHFLDDPKEVWCYWTNTAHQWIDAPNIDARLWSPKVWWMGARGMATWAITLWWEERASLKIENPWVNPFTPWGNGVLAYFYPPSPNGIELADTDLSVVPSLRMVLTRDGIEDYEYAVILERLLAAKKQTDTGVAEGKEALAMMRRQFRTPVTWSLGEVHWLEARRRAAQAIEQLRGLPAKR
jgi:hypothetical protein